jgi:hypothetical protein
MQRSLAVIWLYKESILLGGASLHVVTAIKNNGQNWSRYDQIVKGAKCVLNGLWKWQIGHTKRDANFGAHG